MIELRQLGHTLTRFYSFRGVWVAAEKFTPGATWNIDKDIVTKVLTRHATAILMDPEYGLPALQEKAPSAGVLLAYEKTGYDASQAGR